MRKWNFSAGPAAIPQSVIQENADLKAQLEG